MDDMKNTNDKLFWERSDPERFLGFKSQKFTTVNMLLCFIIGIILSALFYGILMGVRTLLGPNSPQVLNMFFHGGPEQRSTIPYYTVFLSFWSAAIILIKKLKLNVQRKALLINIRPADPNFILTQQTAAEIIANINAAVEDPQHFVLFDRIQRALSNLHNLGNITAAAECLNNQAANDRSVLSSSYTVLRGFIWAIPVLGFIGTVVGLASAVGGFGAVVSKGAELETLKSSLAGVTSGLSVAFETTLIALVAALIVQLFMTFLMSDEERFLDECDEYCHKNIISRIKDIRTLDTGPRAAN